MKILHVVHGYPPSMGGSQVLVKYLSENLAKTYGDQVTVFTTHTYYTHQFRQSGGPLLPVGNEIINGVTIRRFPVFSGLSLLRIAISSLAYRLKLPGNDWLRTLENGPIMFGLKQAIIESKADVIFATAFPLLHIYTALAGAKQANMPIVILGALHPADEWGYNRAMIYRAIQQADAYIAHTPFERDHVIARGATLEKVSIIGGGVEADLFLKADDQAIRQRYQLGDCPVILTLGKQMKRKRLDTLLTAMQLLWQDEPNAYLVIAGAKGDYSLQLEANIAALPEAQRQHVIVISDFADAEKADIIAAADTFVLCSGEESFGIAFVEAWAGGKPVVGARIGAISSLIQDGENGLLFEYENPADLATACLTLLRNASLRSKLGMVGQQLVREKYTWSSITKQIRHVYKQAIATSSRD